MGIMSLYLKPTLIASPSASLAPQRSPAAEVFSAPDVEENSSRDVQEYCQDISIVIAVYNQACYTRTCLDSLDKAGISNSRIIVVDNASTDETPELLASRPQINVIRNLHNRFCGAWSQGARAAAPATWTVILNNDVVIPEGWLEGLVSFAEERGFDVVGSAMCEGDLDYDFKRYAAQFMSRMRNVNRSGVANGACFMVHRRVFESVGFFDEDPKVSGYQDDEFFRRCRRAGFKLAMTGRAFLHHFGSITQNAVRAEIHRTGDLGDRFYYRKKYGITWLERHRKRWLRKLALFHWRTTERLRYGYTLHSRRISGKTVWR
jgi:N-acetylglucosaminyl-diphospho-decaprenol L-rhamnosyltransferase